MIEAEKAIRDALAKLTAPIGNMTDPSAWLVKAMAEQGEYRTATNAKNMTELLAEMERLRVNSVRYEWLKSRSRGDAHEAGVELNWYEPTPDLDATIDAARLAREQS